MKRNSLTLALAGLLAVAGLAAHAETPDPSGQYAVSTASTRTRAQTQVELTQYKQAGVNPWSTSYNPLKYFRSSKSRDHVQHEFVASRDEVRAMTGEDSGSVWLSQHHVQDAGTQIAGKTPRPQ